MPDRRKEQKTKERKERLRREKHEQKFGQEAAAQPAFSAHTSEKSLRKLHSIIEGKNFASAEELNQHLQSLVGTVLDEEPEDDPKSRAQDLAYQAMEQYSPREALRFARAALKLHPDCIDALRIQATSGQNRPVLVIDALRQVAQKGEEALGSEFFQENRGRFWGMLETRPFMRTLWDLAQALTDCGRDLESIQTLERMLELNPNDNQGIRYPLIGLLLANVQLEKAARLLERYPEDSAVILWAQVLERFLVNDGTGALRALDEARNCNPYAEDYLSGRRKLPRHLPDTYRFGEDSEGVICAHELEPALRRHPQWQVWLRQQMIRPPLVN
jgi:tetratricopeptide (TPR) repeat protein